MIASRAASFQEMQEVGAAIANAKDEEAIEKVQNDIDETQDEFKEFRGMLTEAAKKLAKTVEIAKKEQAAGRARQQEEQNRLLTSEASVAMQEIKKKRKRPRTTDCSR